MAAPLLGIGGAVVAQDAETCNAEPEVMMADDGVAFVRTPDACFENLTDWDYEPQYIEIDGLRQGYVDVGSGVSGETILLLHAQPAWSYLYRKMIPEFVEVGQLLILKRMTKKLTFFSDMVR